MHRTQESSASGGVTRGKRRTGFEKMPKKRISDPIEQKKNGGITKRKNGEEQRFTERVSGGIDERGKKRWGKERIKVGGEGNEKRFEGGRGSRHERVLEKEKDGYLGGDANPPGDVIN